jgi:hypothetical protein
MLPEPKSSSAEAMSTRTRIGRVARSEVHHGRLRISIVYRPALCSVSIFLPTSDIVGVSLTETGVDRDPYFLILRCYETCECHTIAVFGCSVCRLCSREILT